MKKPVKSRPPAQKTLLFSASVSLQVTSACPEKASNHKASQYAFCITR
jgi:hypothetical protein